MTDLWQKHCVELVSTSPTPYRLSFYGPPHTPVLDKQIVAWRGNDGNPFPARDLEYHRVGVSDFEVENGTLNCFPATWGQWTLLFGKTRGEIPEEERFDILSVVCMVRTADGQLVCCLRSRNNPIFANVWHAGAAGFVDLDAASESMSVLPQAFRELQEELNVFPCDVHALRQLGLCYHDGISYEILLCAEVSLSAAEVLERSATAQDSWEGKVHLFPESQAREMLETHKWNPAGAAALMLYFGI